MTSNASSPRSSRTLLARPNSPSASTAKRSSSSSARRSRGSSLEIERLGGYVKDLAGDGVLAFFGAPVSHEDDAERALRASLNILQSIAAYSLEVRRGWGIDTFGVRVGVSTGSVALGSIGAGRRLEYAAFGDTVNTAARLQAAAEVGSALVDVATRHRLESLFEWSDRARRSSLKGKAESVSAFRLGAAVPAQSRSRGLGDASVGIFGRDAERLVLHRAVDGVRAGRGGVVSITGRAGIGKSRLLADARAEARPDGGPGPDSLVARGPVRFLRRGNPVLPVSRPAHHLARGERVRSGGSRPRLAPTARRSALRRLPARRSMHPSRSCSGWQERTTGSATLTPQPRSCSSEPSSRWASCLTGWPRIGRWRSRSRTCTGRTPPPSGWRELCCPSSSGPLSCL